MVRGERSTTGVRRRALLVVTLLCALVSIGGSGCVTVTLYEPMGVLQRPTLVDPAASTFSESRIQVRCLGGVDLPSGDAEKLCRFMAQSFRDQGAEVETVVPRLVEDAPPNAAFEGVGADLIVEIASRTEHHNDYPFLATVGCLTCTTIPIVDEQTFRQHVVVRGRSNTVLAEQSFRARFVNYTGWVVWAANYVADWLFRDDDNDISGDLPNKAFSRDFYRQVSQLAFNARVRSDLLGLTARASRPLPAVPPPASTTPSTPSTTPATEVPPPPAATEAPPAATTTTPTTPTTPTTEAPPTTTPTTPSTTPPGLDY